MSGSLCECLLRHDAGPCESLREGHPRHIRLAPSTRTPTFAHGAAGRRRLVPGWALGRRPTPADRLHAQGLFAARAWLRQAVPGCAKPRLATSARPCASGICSRSARPGRAHLDEPATKQVLPASMATDRALGENDGHSGARAVGRPRVCHCHHAGDPRGLGACASGRPTPSLNNR
jgi:hypothetical protein